MATVKSGIVSLLYTLYNTVCSISIFIRIIVMGFPYMCVWAQHNNNSMRWHANCTQIVPKSLTQHDVFLLICFYAFVIECTLSSFVKRYHQCDYSHGMDTFSELFCVQTHMLSGNFNYNCVKYKTSGGIQQFLIVDITMEKIRYLC